MSKNDQRDLFGTSQQRLWTVSQLVGEVRSLLEARFAFIRVVGELYGLTVASSGHAYFHLKDERAALPCVMFRSAVARIGGRCLDEGEEVECIGRLTLYEPRGRTQLVVEWMVPRGVGELGLRFLQLKSRLQAEGLFDPERKRPLPHLPASIGVVTSPTGAAVRDILKVLGRRFPSIPVLIHPVRVQGEGAAEEIANAIDRMGDGEHGEVLIVGRGGGSIEDLWAFNEEVVVRSVARSKVPVVSAVGHETDLVLCDLAADLRAPTPSAAAEMVVPDRVELRQRVAERSKTLARLAWLRLGDARARLAAIQRRMRDPRLVLAAHRLRLDEDWRMLTDAVRTRSSEGRRRLVELRVRLATFEPNSRLKADRARCAQLSARLLPAVRSRLERHRSSLNARTDALGSLNPLAVLSRGYSLATAPDGSLLRRASQVTSGDPISVRLHEGEVDARVARVIPPPLKKA